MKLVIYGVSRSGKDYLIKKLIDHFRENTGHKVIHIEGSKHLNYLSREFYKVSFKHLSESKKDILRRKLIEILNEKNREYDLVIVDGHYSFITHDSYNVVFTEEDKDNYDHFFYLDTPSQMILEFSRNSVGEKRNLKITEEEISDWKMYEKYKLGDICSSIGKELVILDEDTTSSISFVESWVNLFSSKYSFENIAKDIIDENKHKLEVADKVYLLDCDRTVSINDVTYDFCNELNITSKELKNIFRNDRYTSYQFYKMSRLFKSKNEQNIRVALDIALDKVKISQDVLTFIKNDNSFMLMGITSGIFEIWELISNKYNIFDVLIGNRCAIEFDYYVTPLLKKAIVQELKQRGKVIIAIGDSMIDVPMLEVANDGYLVAHQKLNKAVELYIFRKPNTMIKQLFKGHFSYNLNHEDELKKV